MFVVIKIGAKETSLSLWQIDPDTKLHTREIKAIIKVVGGGPFCKQTRFYKL